MRVLVISTDEDLIRVLRSRLEGSGFTVLFSSSLESSFLESGSVVPSLALVDDDAVPDELWQTKKFLGWLHHRSPVFVISQDECSGLGRSCDECFSKPDYLEPLMTSIQALADRLAS
ncbi:MAG: hypothetical protein V3R94_11410 [Acidobacteriota bacterium]